MRFDNMVPLYFQKIATYKETALDHNNTRTREKTIRGVRAANAAKKE